MRALCHHCRTECAWAKAFLMSAIADPVFSRTIHSSHYPSCFAETVLSQMTDDERVGMLLDVMSEEMPTDPNAWQLCAWLFEKCPGNRQEFLDVIYLKDHIEVEDPAMQAAIDAIFRVKRIDPFDVD
jgi:hypothetical protein